MLVAKLKPDTFISRNICNDCFDIQMEYGEIKYCSKCSVNNKECQIISTGSSFWSGDYAVVLIDGKMRKVSMSRLYDVKEVV